MDLLKADRGGILLVGQEGPEPLLRVTRRRDGESWPITLSRSLAAEVIKQKQGVITGDAGVDHRFAESKSMISSGMRSAMCVPMMCGAELLGVMHLDSIVARDLFDEKDLELLTTIASQAALAVKSQFLDRQLNRYVSDERRRLEQLFKVLPDGLLVLDGEHAIQQSNPEGDNLVHSFGKLTPDGRVHVAGWGPSDPAARRGSGPGRH